MTVEELVFGLLLLALYFLPTITAHRRGHHQSLAIGLLNLFLGWTFLGWVVALVWAATAVRKDLKPAKPTPAEMEERWRTGKQGLVIAAVIFVGFFVVAYVVGYVGAEL